MNDKKGQLPKDLLRRTNRTILIILGFIVLAGLLISYLFFHSAATDWNKKAAGTSLNRD